MEQMVQILKLSALRPMENYRKSFDKKKMEELTESVRAKGVIQPICVRMIMGANNAYKDDEFEIVFGNRRFQAATAAGLTEIPAMIRKLNFEDALEFQVIENSQREDPNPMEEANGFKRLLEIGHHTTETLAAKLDKSVGYVLGRLKLVNLPKVAQDKMLSGEIAIGHALQLTRLKNEGDMKRLLKDILDEGMSVRETKQSISQYYGKAMSDAPFDTEACANCESRTRSQHVLFPEARKDRDECLDRSCFFIKTRDHVKQGAAEYEALGIKIVTGEKELEKIIQGGSARRLNLEKDYDYSDTKPNKTAECKKCIANRAFYYYEEKHGREVTLETGWICLDKKCLNKMNRQPGSRSSADTGSASSGPVRNGAVHARAVRDRFLYSVMPEKFQASPVLQKRLLLYHLLSEFDHLHGSVLPEKALRPDDIRREILESFVPGRDLEEATEYGFNDQAYAIIAAIPGKDLDQAIARSVHASLRHTPADVLFRMMPEAGVSMEKMFVVDEKYLKSMTKDGLLEFSKTLKLRDFALDANMKKTEMIDELMKNDLTGRVPAEVAEECELQGLDEICPKVKAKKKK